MVAAEEAWRILGSWAQPIETERVPLGNLSGRVLAEEIRAETPLPPFSRSLVDGYAVRSEDLPGPLPVCGISAAGRPFSGTLPPGKAVRILTGAMVPEGATQVVMQEEVEPADGAVFVRPSPGSSHIQSKGEDARTGELLLGPGVRIGAGQVALLASLGRSEASVFRRLRLAHLLSGDELAPAGGSLSAGTIYDVNGPMMAALLARSGVDRIVQRWVPDLPEPMERTIGEWIPEVDLLILSGGLGPGETDLVPKVLASLGCTIHFHGVEIRPGKPALFASRGRTLVLGLPGNPGAHLALFWLFVKPLLDALSGAPFAIPWQTGRLRVDLPCRPLLRETFWPVTTAIQEGSVWLEPIPWTGSASVRVLAHAQGFARLRKGRGPFAAKELLSFFSFS
ncbi:molybdopterin molybdotransferase MoeA [Methylacidimicrobium sp. B4]|uniref:molybdopterin molybdotransferase MoeA n=1 Tax=Methylacidimicrobium sp. B4 TaxID=2796139 RepID=UPI001A8E8EE3|nr:molybdopterin molybdotransferase MoeA [Methylacidimicrobium sp. B4]QSR83941.1 molybdopterin molybdotransferase MoeA [Methylacidimicrobium sp. B4]